MNTPQPPSVPPPPASRGERTDASKPWYKRWWGIAALVLAALVVIAVVTGEPEEEPVADAEPTPEATAAEPTPEPVDEPEPDPEPEPEPEPEPQESDRRELLAALAFDAIEHTGTGDDVIELVIPDDLLGFVEFTHDGTGNFAVWARDGDGNQIDLLVNTIGSYDGRRALNFDDPAVAMLEITASGAWTASARPLADAPALAVDGVTEGAGDDVVVLFHELPGSQRAAITHEGDGNFAIWAWGDRVDLLVNTIGVYDSAVFVDAGTVVLDIAANGPWTISLG